MEKLFVSKNGYSWFVFIPLDSITTQLMNWLRFTRFWTCHGLLKFNITTKKE